MPIYDLKNTETGEIFEKTMSIKEYEQYLIDNPHIQRHYTKTTMFIDEVAIGRKKPPSDFQTGVLEKIKKNNPGHNMQSRWDTPREW